jgi:hypothetical protein
MAANLLAYGSKLHACDALIRYDAIQRCFWASERHFNIRKISSRTGQTIKEWQTAICVQISNSSHLITFIHRRGWEIFLSS